MPPPEGSPYTEDVIIASCSHPSQLLDFDSGCYQAQDGVLLSFLIHLPLTSCPPLAPRSSGLSKCPQPSALVWCQSARAPPGAGESHFTPHVSPRGPGRRPRAAFLAPQCMPMHTHAFSCGETSRPQPPCALEAQTQTGASGWLCVLGGVSPCLNIARVTGAWLVGLSTAWEPGWPVALRVQEVTRLHALQLIIGGLDKIDLDDWKSNTRLKHCGADSNVVRWFWQAVETFDEERRARLLQFVTGSTRVPLQGFKALQGDCSGGRAGAGGVSWHRVFHLAQDLFCPHCRPQGERNTCEQ